MYRDYLKQNNNNNNDNDANLPSLIHKHPWEKRIILHQNDSFGHQYYVDPTFKKRSHMMRMTKGVRLWHKLMQSPYLKRSAVRRRRIRRMSTVVNIVLKMKRTETVIATQDCIILSILHTDMARIEEAYQEKQSKTTVKALQQFALFSSWPTPPLNRLSRHLIPRRCFKGDVIHSQGTDSNIFYLLVSGTVTLYQDVVKLQWERWPVDYDTWEVRETSDIKTYSVHTLRAPDLFGEEAVLDYPKTLYKAVCVTDASLLVLKRSDFLYLFQEYTISYFKQRVDRMARKGLNGLQHKFNAQYRQRSKRRGDVPSSNIGGYSLVPMTDESLIPKSHLSSSASAMSLTTPSIASTTTSSSSTSQATPPPRSPSPPAPMSSDLSNPLAHMRRSSVCLSLSSFSLLRNGISFTHSCIREREREREREKERKIEKYVHL